MSGTLLTRDLDCLHAKSDAAIKTQLFPFIFSETPNPGGTAATVADAVDDNFQCRFVQSLKRSPTFWSPLSMSHCSCQSLANY